MWHLHHIDRFLLISLALFGLSISSANAALITNDREDSSLTVGFFEPVGQSFTTLDAKIEAGLDFAVVNEFVGNDDSLIYSLYQGADSSGLLLTEVIFSLPDDHDGLYIADFSSVDLTIGQVYSLAVSVVGDSFYWAVHGGTSYASGSLFSSVPPPGSNFLDDLHFYVNGVSPVPAPAAIWLFGTALIGLVGFSKRRKAA